MGRKKPLEPDMLEGNQCKGSIQADSPLNPKRTSPEKISVFIFYRRET